MIPAYLYLPTDNFNKKLPVNKPLPESGNPKQGSSLSKIVADMDRAFRFADAASECSTNRPFNL